MSKQFEESKSYDLVAQEYISHGRNVNNFWHLCSTKNGVAFNGICSR